MAAMVYRLIETFTPLGDNAILELAYKEWSTYLKRSGQISERPAPHLSDVFTFDLTSLRYAVLSSFIGILAVFQVDGRNKVKPLHSWPP